jgi:hypothetical protein
VGKSLVNDQGIANTYNYVAAFVLEDRSRHFPHLGGTPNA